MACQILKTSEKHLALAGSGCQIPQDEDKKRHVGSRPRTLLHLFKHIQVVRSTGCGLVCTSASMDRPIGKRGLTSSPAKGAASVRHGRPRERASVSRSAGRVSGEHHPSLPLIALTTEQQQSKCGVHYPRMN
jgi:hypothetical protein